LVYLLINFNKQLAKPPAVWLFVLILSKQAHEECGEGKGDAIPLI
jgi:hypothetical protein